MSEAINLSFDERLQIVREARILFGADRARHLWSALALPNVPPPPTGPADEARICLRHLLDAPAVDDGARIRELLEQALDDDDEARLLLKGAGIRVDITGDGFLVANRHARIDAIYAGSEWTKGRHMRVLRRLAGTRASAAQRFDGQPMRATFIAAKLLDEWA